MRYLTTVPPKMYYRQRVSGLGAAGVPVRKLLQDSSGNFSLERFDKLKQILIDALTQAQADYARTYEAAQSASQAGYLENTLVEAGNRLKASLERNTLPRLQKFQSDIQKTFDANDPFWDSEEQYRNFLSFIEREVKLFQVDANTLNVAADMSFYKGLQQQADDLFKKAMTAVWVIIAVGAVLILGPLVLKTYSGYKRGGAAGAADAAAGELERGRARVLHGAPRRRRSRR